MIKRCPYCKKIVIRPYFNLYKGNTLGSRNWHKHCIKEWVEDMKNIIEIFEDLKKGK